MSGGHFDYRQFAFEDIAQSIEHEIKTNDSTEKGEFGKDIGNHYPKAVIARFKKAAKCIRKAGDMAHEIDWLLSGDSGVETFLEAWRKRKL